MVPKKLITLMIFCFVLCSVNVFADTQSDLWDSLHWGMKFDEVYGSNRTDDMKENYNGTLYNGAIVVNETSPVSNTTLDLFSDAVFRNEHGILVDLGLALDGDFTFAWWSRSERINDDGQVRHWDIQSGFMMFGEDFDGNPTFQESALLTDNEHDVDDWYPDWYHNTIIFDETNSLAKWYMNGTNIYNFTYNGNNVGGQVAIGDMYNRINPQGSGQGYHGHLDEFYMFNKTLTQTEIDWLYNNELTEPAGAPADNSPTIINNLPINNTNQTNNMTFEFSFNVTDDLLLENVSLYIDGTFNQTQTISSNGTYYFNITFPNLNKTFNWNGRVCDNNSQCVDSVNWTGIVYYNYTDPSGNISNQQLVVPSGTMTTNTEFNVTSSFDCDVYDCTNINRTVYFDTASCSVQSPKNTSEMIGIVTANTTYSEGIPIVCTSAETININISLYYYNNNLSTSDSLTIELPGGLTDTETSCLTTGYYSNETICAVGMAQAGLNMIGILGTLAGFMIFFLVLYFWGDSLTDFMGGTKWLSFLKPTYFIIAMGISYVILWTVGELASSNGVADNIVNVLQFLLIPYAIICVLIGVFIMLGFTQQATDFNKAVNEGRK